MPAKRLEEAMKQRMWWRLAALTALCLATLAGPITTAHPVLAATGTLLSQGKPATASTEGGSGYAASFAVDGNTGTRWASVRKADPQWLAVDLGGAAQISEITLLWGASCATAYQLQTSADGKTWTSIYSTTTGAGGTEDITVNGTGRYVRMYGTARCRAD